MIDLWRTKRSGMTGERQCGGSEADHRTYELFRLRNDENMGLRLGKENLVAYGLGYIESHDESYLHNIDQLIEESKKLVNEAETLGPSHL